jgi:tRNA 2-selenouridine synthase
LAPLVGELLTEHYDPLYARSQRSHFQQWAQRKALSLLALDEEALRGWAQSLISA